MTVRDVLVAAAWAEHEAARAGYKAEKARLREAGKSKAGVSRSREIAGPRARLRRAWLSLHELGEVPLDNNRRYRRGRKEDDDAVS